MNVCIRRERKYHRLVTVQQVTGNPAVIECVLSTHKNTVIVFRITFNYTITL